MENLFSKYWNKFKYGNYLTKILYINIAVFLLVSFSRLFVFLFHFKDQSVYYILNYLMLPANVQLLKTMPWTIFTYMFTHEEILHIVFNMLWFYWFGKIFIDYLSSKKLLYTYIIGGIFGALFYILAFNIFPAFQEIVHTSKALGASASVIAVVVTISFYVPEYRLNLLFIGQVKLKHIAIFTIIIDFLSIASENSGGHIAHLGGAFYGFCYGFLLRQPKIKLQRFKIPFFKKPKKNSYYKNVRNMSDEEYNYQKAQLQKEIDRILDKIAKYGYDSLTKKEKETLFKA
ncbi:MAG: rhomboid family intramembrane serine protease, partial [Bacteroidales bacterium]